MALVMGLQHALAMVGGLITPPLLISNLGFGTRPGTSPPVPYSSGNPAETQRCECDCLRGLLLTFALRACAC